MLRRVTDPVGGLDGLGRLDADQDVVGEVVVREEVVTVVGRDEAQSQLLRELDASFIDLLLTLDAVVLELEPVAILAE